jgi:hypothetical protein
LPPVTGTAALEEVVTQIVKRERHERSARTARSARSEATRAESLPASPTKVLYIAVVHAADGVRFSAVAESRYELVHRIAEYVRQWGGYVLRPDHARHLRGLLARGEWEAAIELYFGLVGKRWDKEWLVTAAAATADGRRDVAGVLGEVVVPEALRAADRKSDTGDREPGITLARAL